MSNLKMFDKLTVWAMVMMAGFVSIAVEGDKLSCLRPLVTCDKFLNNTDTPNKSCCTQMQLFVEKDMSCLCFLFLTPEALKSLNSDYYGAYRVAKVCVPSLDLNVCIGLEDYGDNGDNGDHKDNGDNKDNENIGKPKNDAKRLTLTIFTSLLMFFISLVF